MKERGEEIKAGNGEREICIHPRYILSGTSSLITYRSGQHTELGNPLGRLHRIQLAGRRHEEVGYTHHITSLEKMAPKGSRGCAMCCFPKKPYP
jgi:hypothetical protein